MSAADILVPSLTQRCSLALEETRGEVNRGTSGYVDGVRVGNFVSWRTARIHPPREQQVPGRKQGVPANMGEEHAITHWPG